MDEGLCTIARLAKTKMTTDIVIVGGGLAGLALARHLHAAGREFVLLEARNRLGGRISSVQIGVHAFDLGPAWFWPGQPRMESLVADLGLQRFDQFSAGAAIYEDENGRVQSGRGFASMQGSFRLAGGFSRLIEAMAADLPKSSLRLSKRVNQIHDQGANVLVTTDDGNSVCAKQVVLCLPPRLAADLIRFEPELAKGTVTAMQGIPTWMAGHAKALAIYSSPFWREAGLSGDAFSRIGPMIEIHNASPQKGPPFALFGFLGTPPDRRTNQTLLQQAISDQFGRIFGPKAARPDQILVKDWAREFLTATGRDHAPLTYHPRYGLPAAMADLWDDKLLFGGTEVAPQFGGFLEGALEAAENALDELNRKKPKF